jgi:uncharacterized protein with PQ loop repeat
MSLTSFLGAWCLILSISFVWPQAFRVVRHDTPHGISPIGTVHAIVGSVQWFTFGIMLADPVVYVSNGSFIAAQLVIASVLLRHRALTYLLLLSGAVLAVVLALAGATVSTSLVGIFAILISTTSIIPPTLHVYRTRNLHGLSVVSLSITLMSNFSWLFYGLAQRDLILMAPNFIFAPCVTYMLVRAWRWHHSEEARQHEASLATSAN